jgi:hypothetical protein
VFRYVSKPEPQSIDEELGVTVSGGGMPPPGNHMFIYREADLEFYFYVDIPETLKQAWADEWGIRNGPFERHMWQNVRRKSSRQRLAPEDIARIKKNIMEALAVFRRPPEGKRPRRIVRFTED